MSPFRSIKCGNGDNGDHGEPQQRPSYDVTKVKAFTSEGPGLEGPGLVWFGKVTVVPHFSKRPSLSNIEPTEFVY